MSIPNKCHEQFYNRYINRNESYYMDIQQIGFLFSYLIKLNMQYYKNCSERNDYEQLLNQPFEKSDKYWKNKYRLHCKILLKNVHSLIRNCPI